MKIKLKIIFLSTVLLIGQSDSQIKQARQMIEKSGMSQTQIKKIASSKGYSETQIQKGFQKIEDLDKKKIIENDQINDQIKEASQPFNDEELSNNLLATGANDEDLVINEELESIQKQKSSIIKYFGYDIFRQDPLLFQSSSVGAVDPNYYIGPGDEIIVMLWGQTQFRQVFTVDREGFIFIPEVGQVFVNGLNLSLLESKLFKVFSQSYESLNPQGKPSTSFLDISLGNLRPLRIQVLGEVSQPGAYTVSPSATLFSSIYYFNGPTVRGSLRDIQLIRNGNKVASIDFYDYLLTGKKIGDLNLQLDDVIFIPPRLKSIAIKGEISRSGIYEVKPEESLSDLINIAGKLKVSAYLNRAQIDRVVPFKDRKKLLMDRTYLDIDLNLILEEENNEKFELVDGDIITILSISDQRSNAVNLSGAVSRTGWYDIGSSINVKQLIDKADGILGDAYLDRIDIVRTKPDFTKELIELNLSEILDGKANADIALEEFDEIKVYSISEMKYEKFVYITGEVIRGGRYQFQENMKVLDLIFKSGGLIDEEFKKEIFLDRGDLFRINDSGDDLSRISFNLENILNDPKSKDNLELRIGDKVKLYNKNVFVKPKLVNITGAVFNPGTYDFFIDMTVGDLILQSGGLSSKSLKYEIEIARNQREIKGKIVNQDVKIEIFDYEILHDVNHKISSELENLLVGLDSIKIFPYDNVTVRATPFLEKYDKIIVEGEVLFPGEYVITNPKETISSIVERAGGLLPEAYPFASSFVSSGVNVQLNLEKSLNKPGRKYDFIVQNGDVLKVRKNKKLIVVNGEVNVPGAYQYQEGLRVSEFIRIAGGLTANAEKKQIYIRYPNGVSLKYSRFIKNRKVYDGSIITVGIKPEKESFDRTQFASDIANIIASLSQTIALILITR
jgi:polysaccharide biosynthesis/export protein